jgi:hypothetical protein
LILWLSILLLVALLLIGIVVNALLMLISPGRWRRLPWWFKALSGIPSEKHDRRAAMQTRMTGVVLLAVMAVVTYSLLPVLRCVPSYVHLARAKPPLHKST